MFILSQILQYVFSGIIVGSIYALIAVGFVTIYNVTGIINFTQGEFVMLGAMVLVTLTNAHVPMALSFFITVLAVSLIGALLERISIYPARTASIITLIIITIGASITIRGIALLIWGTDPFPLESFSKGPPLVILGASILRQGIWVLGMSVVVMVLLHIFFEHTLTGKALKACSINPQVASLMGIKVETMSLLSFFISAGLGAIAGIVIVPITYATYDMGVMLGLKGFVAAIMGGLTNAPAAVLGGILLGILESLGAGLIHSGYKDAIAFIILLAVLFTKPGGFFAKK